MIKTILKIFILISIFGTVVFSGLIPGIIQLVSDFNSNVVVFIPPEARVLISFVVFLGLLKFYQMFTD